MKTIKNIIVPTDFSVTARNAYDYAERLSEATDAIINVVHVNEYYLPISEIAVAPLSEQEESRLQASMEEFLSEETDTPVLVKNKVKSTILRGDPVERIVSLTHHNAADVVVMGTTGLQDFMSKIIGTVSLEVANQAQCPVVLVPREATWRPIRRILFASNQESITTKMVREVANWAEKFGAAIHFVYVEADKKKSAHQLTATIWDELFAHADPQDAFEIHTIYDNNPVVGLRQYAYDNEIDLIVFVSKHRSFWQNIMHYSITEKFSISSDRAMMVLHFDD
jgi:nucleotide-binding universal stress UspA family protein